MGVRAFVIRTFQQMLLTREDIGRSCRTRGKGEECLPHFGWIT
jgi:hypothetical protein